MEGGVGVDAGLGRGAASAAAAAGAAGLGRGADALVAAAAAGLGRGADAFAFPGVGLGGDASSASVDRGDLARSTGAPGASDDRSVPAPSPTSLARDDLIRSVSGVRRAGVPSDRAGIEDFLRTTRRAINELELVFAEAASALQGAWVDEPWMDAGDSPWRWIRDECHMTGHATSVAVNIGDFQNHLQDSIAAVSDSKIGFAHLGWMANTAHRLAQSSSSEVEFSEQMLLSSAEKMGIQRFRRECDNLVHAADRAAFVEAEDAGVVYRRLDLRSYEDGSLHIEGLLDREGGAIVRAALDPLAKRAGPDDERTVGRRNADALVECFNHVLESGRLPRVGGERPHLHVTTSLETLLNFTGAPAAVIDSGALLSSLAAARLACDGTIVRVILDSDSMVVDVGRSKRVVPSSTRRALAVRDKGCSWPGCDRPASWTQAHHLMHWSSGGNTDVDNLVLLCLRHHWMVHEGGWTMIRGDDGVVMTLAPAYPLLWNGRDPTVDAA